MVEKRRQQTEVRMRTMSGAELTTRDSLFRDRKFIEFPDLLETRKPPPMRPPRTRIRRMPRQHRTS